MPTTKFCSVADVHAHINTVAGFSGDDALITTHIQQATALLRNFTRRKWDFGNYTQFFKTEDINIAIGVGDAVARFTLKERPLVSVTEVKFNTGGEWDNTDPVPTTAYEVDLDANAVVVYPQRMTSHARSLRVRYTAGFIVDEEDDQLLLVDENLRQACAVQAAFTFRRMLNETSGSSLKQDRKGLMQYRVAPSGLVMEAQALVRGYASVLVGGNG
jgi:hypothetical protein